MKKLLFLVLSIIAINTLNAQSTKFIKGNYLGEDYDLYNGLLFRADMEDIMDFDNSLFLSKENAQNRLSSPVAYPRTDYKWRTQKDSLSGKIYQVRDIIRDFQNPIFTLVNIKSEGDTLYYVYDTRYEHSFIWETSEVTFSDQYIKQSISREVDDFTNEITISSPLLKPVGIEKVISKGKSVYYLSLEAPGSTVNVREKGVYIIFTDGTKWIRTQEDIDVRATEEGYKYSAFIKLSQQDLILFQTKQIDRFKLFIYANGINNIEGKKFKKYVSAIVKMR